MNNKTAQPQFVKPVSVNPVYKLSCMYFDMRKIKDLLLQTKEQPHSLDILSEGEKGSIDAMIVKLTERMEFIKELQLVL